tara:strand:- start:675 stop:1544 length:870 start_codon:yes stop_codon:yes gene_type:complete
MQRSAATGEISYSPEDILLFRESPFACWMERLTLENPDHGITPDTVVNAANANQYARLSTRQRVQAGGNHARGMPWQEFIAAATTPSVAAVQHVHAKAQPLHAADADDALSIARHASEQQRTAHTLAAMQQGLRCIANAQLTVGPLSCHVDLLLRVDGVSDLGSHLYLPCDTRGHLRRQRAFHLVFAADLLSSLQGVLPPEMLVLLQGEPIETLPTAEHILLFREVRKRFLASELAFRKHSMPDPAESAHFGRWTRCAQDILKHRAAAALAARGTAVVRALDCAVGKTL